MPVQFPVQPEPDELAHGAPGTKVPGTRAVIDWERGLEPVVTLSSHGGDDGQAAAAGVSKPTQTERPVKIVYLHGWGSAFDPSSDKVAALSRLGPVEGFDIDYTLPHEALFEAVETEIAKRAPDLLVGTSMGGWLAAWMSARLEIPFVALNPATTPSRSLQRYPEFGTDYLGRPYRFSHAVVARFPDMTTAGEGAVFVDLGDEVIPPEETVRLLGDAYRVTTFEGGDHRFRHVDEVIARILSERG